MPTTPFNGTPTPPNGKAIQGTGAYRSPRNRQDANAATELGLFSDGRTAPARTRDQPSSVASPRAASGAGQKVTGSRRSGGARLRGGKF